MDEDDDLMRDEYVAEEDGRETKLGTRLSSSVLFVQKEDAASVTVGTAVLLLLVALM